MLFRSIQMDTFYLCDKNSLILFEAERDSLLFRQMEKVGLAPSDSIPDDLYPDILRLDLDSALYVFGEISCYCCIFLYGFGTGNYSDGSPSALQ